MSRLSEAGPSSGPRGVGGGRPAASGLVDGARVSGGPKKAPESAERRLRADLLRCYFSLRLTSPPIRLTPHTHGKMHRHPFHPRKTFPAPPYPKPLPPFRVQTAVSSPKSVVRGARESRLD